ncbi:hypothetical protein [Prescottella agglutinans]|uniref:Cell wall assembly regulator SMI1 n=1 Tax=Prescottella agglutinans TaxID=1644129 RepID=A0ABT6MFN9_9NOCA|nr:hypothetical protein [Prescottella agglutinans]MDH6283127.1 cell wall assembly regulator SMI1 [Prescottella agglutinans]
MTTATITPELEVHRAAHAAFYAARRDLIQAAEHALQRRQPADFKRCLEAHDRYTAASQKALQAAKAADRPLGPLVDDDISDELPFLRHVLDTAAGQRYGRTRR